MRIGLIILAVILIGGLITVLQSVFIINPTQQALVLQFGEVRQAERAPGLYFKLPFVQDVEFLDKRVRDLNVAEQEIIAADQKRLVVDAFMRYRIANPVRFFQTVRDLRIGEQRLSTFAESSLRAVLADATFVDIVRDDRAQLMRRISEEVSNRAEGLGVQIVDVKIRRADLPEANSEAIFTRMETERSQEATQIRAQGDEAARRIRAAADRQATVLRAEAEREGEQIRGEGDARRNAIFAQAFAQDPDFFAFYRAMQAYERGLQSQDTRLVLSPDAEFFRYFNDPMGRRMVGSGTGQNARDGSGGGETTAANGTGSAPATASGDASAGGGAAMGGLQTGADTAGGESVQADASGENTGAGTSGGTAQADVPDDGAVGAVSDPISREDVADEDINAAIDGEATEDAGVSRAGESTAAAVTTAVPQPSDAANAAASGNAGEPGSGPVPTLEPETAGETEAAPADGTEAGPPSDLTQAGAPPERDVPLGATNPLEPATSVGESIGASDDAAAAAAEAEARAADVEPDATDEQPADLGADAANGTDASETDDAAPTGPSAAIDGADGTPSATTGADAASAADATADDAGVARGAQADDAEAAAGTASIAAGGTDAGETTTVE